VARKVIKLIIHSDEVRDNRVQEVMAMVGKNSKEQKFNGVNLTALLVEKMVGELTLTVPYLNKVNKDGTHGLLNIPFLYWCRKKGNDGKEIINPCMTRVSVEIDLPAEGTIPNPLHSPHCMEYVMKWINKCGLFCNAINGIITAATGKVNFGSNASAEGTFGSKKNFSSHFSETYSSAENLMNRR